jgi:hypothetical protein
MQSFINFITNQEFLILFSSTVAASLTMVLLQFINQFVADRRKKLYAVAYFIDIAYRMMFISLTMKKHTIVPHIKATKKILTGDREILRTMFLADEFDVLTDEPFQPSDLPEEYKVLVGIDDMNLIQSYEFLSYSSKNTTIRKSLNEFVKANLKSHLLFAQKPDEVQQDILNTYWDYMSSIEHEEDRVIFHVLYTAVPQIKEYIKTRQFLFFSKQSINKMLALIGDLSSKYRDVIPEEKVIKDVLTGGIQRMV